MERMKLYQKQLALEKEAIEEGNAKYIRGITDAIAQGRFDEIPQGQALMKVMFTPVRDKIQEYFDTPLRGHTKQLQSLIKVMGDADEIAYITVAVLVKKIAHHNNKAHLSSVASYIGRTLKRLLYFNRLQKDNPKLHAYLGKEYRRASAKRKEMLVEKHIKSVYAKEDMEGSEVQDIRIGTTLLDLVMKSGIDIIEKRLTGKKSTKKQKRYELSLSQWAIDLIGEMRGSISYTMKPMIIPPVDWTGYDKGGYLVHKCTLVKERHWLQVKHAKKEDYTKVMPIINKLQKTSWRVNKRVYDVVSTIFDNNMVDPRSPPDLPRLYGDLPTRDAINAEDIVGNREWINSPTPEQKKEYGAWNKHREQVIIGLDGEIGRRLQFLLTKKMAKEMLEYDRFWYVYTMDYRGRVYPYTDFLTPQSKGSTKAMLEFAEGKLLDKTGEYWLKIHTANTFGLDKEPFGKRIEWFEKNVENILKVSNNPMEELSFWAYSDSPYEFLASCYAYSDYMSGLPVHLPIQLDAVNSGVQFYSGLLLDKEGAEATCVIGLHRADLYQKVADRVNEKLLNGEYPKLKVFTKSDGTEKTVSTNVEAESLAGKVTRSMVKTNVMTVPYSVTHRGMKMQNWDIMDKMKREGKAFWKGDDWVVNYLLTELTHDSIFEIVKGARLGQEYIKAIADIKDDVSIWTNPLYGFKVFQPSYKRKEHRIQTPLGTLEISVGTTEYNRRKELSSVAANYIHSLDSTLLLYCVDNAIGDIGVIHDCFLVHPNDGSDIRNNYKEGYIKIMEGRPLEQLSKELDPEGEVEIPYIGDLNLKEVRGSLYIIS